jgi:hypothetical protein
MSDLNQTRLENLILARLLVTSKTAPAAAQVRKDVGKFVEHRLTPGEWKSQFDRRLDSLAESDLITRKPLTLTGNVTDAWQGPPGRSTAGANSESRSGDTGSSASGRDPALARIRYG